MPIKKPKNQKTKKLSTAKKATKKKSSTTKKATKKVMKSVTQVMPKLSLDELFDSLFEKQAEPVKTDKSLDQLFDEIFADEQKGSEINKPEVFDTKEVISKASEFDALLDDFVAQAKKTKVVGPTSSILYSANDDLRRYEQALAEAISPKFVLKKLGMAVSVAFGVLVIGICWLQVTYGYFTELDNVSTSGGIQEVIGQNVNSFKNLQQESSKSFREIMQKYENNK